MSEMPNNPELPQDKDAADKILKSVFPDAVSQKKLDDLKNLPPSSQQKLISNLNDHKDNSKKMISVNKNGWREETEIIENVGSRDLNYNPEGELEQVSVVLEIPNNGLTVFLTLNPTEEEEHFSFHAYGSQKEDPCLSLVYNREGLLTRIETDVFSYGQKTWLEEEMEDLGETFKKLLSPVCYGFRDFTDTDFIAFKYQFSQDGEESLGRFLYGEKVAFGG